MDIKRLLLALMLSFVFIVSWNVFFPPDVPEEPVTDVTLVSDDEVKGSTINDVKKTEPVMVKGDIAKDEIKVVTPLLEIGLTNGASSIKNLKIIENKSGETYRHTGAWDRVNNIYNPSAPVELIQNGVCNPCLLIDDSPVYFTNHNIDVNNNQQIVTSWSEQNIIKKTIINSDSYTVDHVFQNLPEKNIVLLWDQGLVPSEKLVQDDMAYFSVYAQNKDSYEEEYLSSVDDKKTFVFDDKVGWAGLKSKYFMKAITNNNYQSFKTRKVVFNVYPSNVIDGIQTVGADMECHYNYYDLENRELKISSYVGPIDLKYLNQEQNKHLSQLFGFGWFFIGYLGKAIMWLLTSLYAVVPNYGIVCILFAFIIRVFTGPLTKKSFLSNQKMQAIQPKLKKIQEKYKDDATRLNQEIMGLYQKEGVNPLGGCLPILVQMPLLIALFQVFRKTIEFRGASFLPFWITDLSQPDVVLQFDFLKNIWGISYFFGHGIALLPIIMGVVMFLNMKMTTTSNVNPSQTSTMYIMNGFFILLFNTFPSGLNLYYTVYNILNFFQQKKLQKLNS